jgi:hypothetical protein
MNTRHYFLRQSCPILFSVLLVVLLHVPTPALEMGPGMFMVQDVPPGREVDLHKLGGIRFTIYNRSATNQDYTLRCARPGQGGLATWEKGYEEIPNAAWCYLQESVITVPAQGEKQVGLIINIPDEPENYNRKFMLAVILTSGKTGNTSVGLAVACRVQIETAVNEEVGAATAAPLAVVPGTLTVRGKPGDPITGSVLVRNNTSNALSASLERLPQIYDDPVKHPRYYSNGFLPQTSAWLEAPFAAFPLAAGAEQRVQLTGTIPATAENGTKTEALAFIRATSAEGKEIITFVRLHCLVGEQPETHKDREKKDDVPTTTPVQETPLKP